MSKSSLRRAAERQKTRSVDTTAADSAPVTEATTIGASETPAVHTDSDGTDREIQVVETADIGSVENVLGTIVDAASGETVMVGESNIPNEPTGGEIIPADVPNADGEPLGPDDVTVVNDEAVAEIPDDSGDGSELTTESTVDPAILAAMAAENAAPESTAVVASPPVAEPESPANPTPASPTETVASPPIGAGVTPSAFQRLSSRNDPEAHALLKKATERRAAGETNNLTVNAAADLLRASSNDTAIVTIAKTDKGVTYTTKVPDCKEMKGLRRKAKDGYVGELTMAGRMLAMLEANGGSMQAEALHQAMVARYQNYDRGYLRGTGLKVYALWTVTEATAAATGGSPTPAVAAQGQAAA